MSFGVGLFLRRGDEFVEHAVVTAQTLGNLLDVSAGNKPIARVVGQSVAAKIRSYRKRPRAIG